MLANRNPTTSPSLKITSYGRDNIDDTTALPVAIEDQDLTVEMDASVWSVPSSTKLTIRFVNKTGGAITLGNYVPVLLEFVNGEDRGHWRQTRADTLSVLDMGEDATQDITLTLENPLAVGEHILVLAAHDGTNLVNSLYSSSSSRAQKFTVYSRLGVPGNLIEWELK